MSYQIPHIAVQFLLERNQPTSSSSAWLLNFLKPWEIKCLLQYFMAWFVQVAVRKILVPDFIDTEWFLIFLLWVTCYLCQKKIFLFLGVCLFLCLSWRASTVLYRNVYLFPFFLLKRACFQTMVILKPNIFFCSNSQSSHFSSNKETGLPLQQM